MYTINLRNKPNKNGECPLIIRLIKGGKQKIITLPYKCLPNQWDESKNRFKKSYPFYHNANKELIEIEARCADIKIKLFKEYNAFGVEDFYNEFFRNDIEADFYSFWETESLRFKNLKKISSYKTMLETLRVFKKFYNNYSKIQAPKFSDISVQVLKDFEAYLFQNGNKKGGVYFKMRYIRSVFNKAIQEGVITEEIYPFKKYKISTLKEDPQRRALSENELKKLLQFNVSIYPNLQHSYLIFIFSILARGINFKDLILLTKKDIREDRIFYKRSKTGAPLNIKIDEDMNDILKFFEYKTSSDFLFPLLKSSTYSAEELYTIQRSLIRKYNKDLERISKILDFKEKITSYVARHTYATSMKFKGISIEYIGETMGHKDISVTKAYLKGFEQSHLDEAVEKGLSIFKNK